MSICYLFGLLLTILLIQGCWGGEETKNVSCASLRTGNAFKYCVKEKEKPKRVEWQSVISNKTSTWLASWLCQHKNTTQAPNVIDVSYSCITLLDCVNVDHTAISDRSEHLTHFNVSGASDESKKPLEKEPDSQNTTADGDHPDTNRGDTSLSWKIIVGVVALLLVIAGLLLVVFCVYKSWRDKQYNQGHRDVEAGQGIPEPNSIPLMQNEQRDASDQGGEPGEESRQPMDNEETGTDNPLLNGDASGQEEEGVLGMEDGKLSDNDRADTEICQKTHADSHPLNVHKVVRVNSQTDDPQLLGQPQSNGHVPYRRESHLTNGAPGQGAGETSPLLCSPGEEGVLEGQDRKSADSGGTDPESCQKTHAEPPLVNGHQDVRVNDETKEATPGAQSPGPPQMNGGPPMSNRAAEETTALLDKQALDKDQVTKPPELIDQGPNDMESRGEL
ncbi:uncharacterized protein LOC112225760 isoform X2 [Oncorhynchus tshawytscha]|uniref:uncharacterized protein LOC112225760 isoform X2 n=1 Tax=Oncorhynchus tshawytscha TaxID=74940 RepID=UPI001C3C6768|nr:uncharacterized protein LOC112225760 isoform X2 [Oncorhynchus tshawytscha]